MNNGGVEEGGQTKPGNWNLGPEKALLHCSHIMSQLVSPRSTANTGDGPLRNRVVALTTNNLTPWLTNPPFSDNTQFYGMPLCYHQMPLKGEWHSWAIDQPSPLHGLPMYFSGSCYGAWSSENGFPVR